MARVCHAFDRVWRGAHEKGRTVRQFSTAEPAAGVC
jgi:hypothetical protein